VIIMAGTLRVRRSRGALSGVLLVLLGVWGALIPFVGPYFHYAYTPDRAFAVTAGRMWLEVLPGAVTLIAGVVVLISRLRPAAVLGAWLATLAGAWFAVGDVVAGRWARLPRAGTPVGGAARSLVEQIGFFTGLGIVIVFVAALALGRLTVVAARDTAAATTGGASAAGAEAVTAGSGRTGALRRTESEGGLRQLSMVPVFRGRQRGVAASASAGRAAAEADNAAAKAGVAQGDGT
jgi:hypothetical protein